MGERKDIGGGWSSGGCCRLQAGHVGSEGVCGCGVVGTICEYEERYASAGGGIVHGVNWDLEKMEGDSSRPLHVPYTTLNCIWCKTRGEVERFDQFDEIWVCIG